MVYRTSVTDKEVRLVFCQKFEIWLHDKLHLRGGYFSTHSAPPTSIIGLHPISKSGSILLIGYSITLNFPNSTQGLLDGGKVSHLLHLSLSYNL